MLWKSKTFWTGIGTIGFGVVLITQGEQEKGIQTILAGLGLIFLRQGVEKK